MSDLVNTRRSLHAVAELLLAGPQYRACGTIKLTVTPSGFATIREPVAELTGGLLRYNGRTAELHGRTIAEVGDEVDLAPDSLDSVYMDGCGLDASHLLDVDADAAAEICHAFARGDQALADFAPTCERVLWPEHFDIGISLEEVNYGVSPGDSFLPVPYAYVGPWHLEGLSGAFWNAPFGAARRLDEIEDLAGFFTEGSRSVSDR